jgi:hypothetical protein
LIPGDVVLAVEDRLLSDHWTDSEVNSLFTVANDPVQLRIFRDVQPGNDDVTIFGVQAFTLP